jgi:hypothetical protein
VRNSAAGITGISVTAVDQGLALPKPGDTLWMGPGEENAFTLVLP